MIISWKGYRRNQLCPNLRYYPGIFLEGVRKTTKTSVRIASLQTDLKPGSPKYEVGVLTT
jgi:hypothetical protein